MGENLPREGKLFFREKQFTYFSWSNKKREKKKKERGKFYFFWKNIKNKRNLLFTTYMHHMCAYVLKEILRYFYDNAHIAVAAVADKAISIFLFPLSSHLTFLFSLSHSSTNEQRTMNTFRSLSHDWMEKKKKSLSQFLCLCCCTIFCLCRFWL